MGILTVGVREEGPLGQEKKPGWVRPDPQETLEHEQHCRAGPWGQGAGSLPPIHPVRQLLAARSPGWGGGYLPDIWGEWLCSPEKGAAVSP